MLAAHASVALTLPSNSRPGWDCRDNLRETTRPSQTAKREETKAAIVAIVSALVECSDDAVHDDAFLADQVQEPRGL